MFFTKKTQESLLEEIRNLFQTAFLPQLQERWEPEHQTSLRVEETLTRQQQLLESLTARLDSQEEQIRENGKRIRRQSDSFEDLLETLQDRENQETALESLLKEKKQKEQALIALAGCCRDQMDLFRQLLARDTGLGLQRQKAWQEQLDMMEGPVQAAMRACGMEETGCVGDPADYHLCEILEPIDTQDRQLDGTIARVYRKGRLYCGQVITKAQVAVYRCPTGPDTLQTNGGLRDL